MKRFYCTVCKKIKRVQSYPDRITGLNPLQPNPTNRVGICNHHPSNHKLHNTIKSIDSMTQMAKELAGVK